MKIFPLELVEEPSHSKFVTHHTQILSLLSYLHLIEVWNYVGTKSLAALCVLWFARALGEKTQNQNEAQSN